ncbi:phosphoserine transaminase [Bartonella sp. TP]|uniref:phosphoserine transaminase n=1 Tax=Bartonella sp. TP TaxID=3057550 RepID=UPI0025AFE99A|nr:phosphoserine transaminase [Bartonella sp. TP]MDN5248875.1 phosphoserine transaminase [Alphaproteobacteria bacterium]WJW79601.1 phosphoserine transaminase [Bartonella sp. TP]
MITMPKLRPSSPHFSSGPCKKHANWSLLSLANAAIERSHRSEFSQAKLRQAIKLTRELLKVPDDYKLALVPASDTGAMEMALWNLLGPNPVVILLYEYFAKEWLHDITVELKLVDVQTIFADNKLFAQLSGIDFRKDFVFVLNGTTIGMSLPKIDFIPIERQGLVICDASAAAFSQELDFSRLDVVTFSCQKTLGAEANQGIIILSPKALQRLESYSPSWPIPKILRLKKDKCIDYELFQGRVINTPSMLCIEDYLDSLLWVKATGGVPALIAKTLDNAKIVADYVKASTWLDYIVKEEALRAKTAQCLRIIDPDITRLTIEGQREFIENMLNRLACLNIAYDIRNHREAPLGFRIWTGASIEADDLRALCEWLDFTFFEAKHNLNYNFA